MVLLIYPHFPRSITTNIIYSSFSYEETKEINRIYIGKVGIGENSKKRGDT